MELYMAAKKKWRKALLAFGIVLGLLVSIYAVCTYIPVQRAIYPDELGKYENAIAVKCGMGVPTGCVMIGDSAGLFDGKSKKRRDIRLQGAVPPYGKPGIKYGSDYNMSHRQYVCFVEYNGKQPYGEEGLFDTYTVTDWAPLGSINRGGVPAWLMPQGYTCLWDVLL